VVLVGGFGTRLRSLTETVKKELLPLVDRPILDHTLDRLVRHGVQDVVVSSPYLEAVDVGDGALTDIEGARRAGLVGVWVDRGLAAPAGGPRAPPASIRALADLPGVLGVASERRSR